MNPADLLKAVGGVRTPINPMQLSDAINGASQTGSNGGMSWMGPARPIDATQQQLAGRAFDFPVGVNLQYTPRGSEKVTFNDLRALADNYDVLRLLIETRKDQLVKIKWGVQPINIKEKIDNDPRIKKVESFFKQPMQGVQWQAWLRMLVEDMLVIDAATLYPRKTRSGDLYSLELIDGATIKKVIDDFGRAPLPPEPAYQQVLKGVPAIDYTLDDLIYAPRNQRVHKLYGFGPVEQIVMTVNIALRRQISQLQYFSEGSTPDLIMMAPPEWTAEQVKRYQEYWDNLLAGNTGARRGARWVPSGVQPYDTKAKGLKDDYDEWLCRVCCYAFSIPPTAFTKAVNRATAETAQDAALSEGLIPMMQWIKDLVDGVIWKYFGFTDLCFTWEAESEQQPDVQSKILDQKLRNGTLTVNEARAIEGRDPVEGGDRLMIYTAQGAVPLDLMTAVQELPTATPAGQPAAKHDHEGHTIKKKRIY